LYHPNTLIIFLPAGWGSDGSALLQTAGSNVRAMGGC